MGVTVERGCRDDLKGTVVLIVRKSKGKLSVDEIVEAVRRSGFFNYYALLLNISEEASMGDGWLNDEISKPGDSVEILPLDYGNSCPLCGEMLPEKEYCNACGAKLSVVNKS